MSRTSRMLRALILAATVGSLMATPALAAKGPKPPTNGPSFSVSLNRDVYSAAGQQYVAMTFTSTEAKASKGLARVSVPARQVPPYGIWTFFSFMQSTDPGLDNGYVRVEATTCASATLASLTPGTWTPPPNQVPASVPTIEVAFSCNPGESFVIHWFTQLGYLGFDRTVDPESWFFQVDTRKGPDAKWTSLAPIEIKIRAVYLTLPPLPFITPPLQLVDLQPVATQPDEPQTWFMVGDGTALDVNVTSEVTFNRIFRADTGEELVIVDPYGFRVDQTDLEVISCLDLSFIEGVDTPTGVPPFDFSSDCLDMPEVMQVRPNPGSLRNLDGSAFPSQIAVVVGVLDVVTGPNQWNAAESRCLFRGGTYLEHANSTDLWRCTLPAGVSSERYLFVANELRQAAYCPTGKIRNDPGTIAQQMIVCTT